MSNEAMGGKWYKPYNYFSLLAHDYRVVEDLQSFWYCRGYADGSVGQNSSQWFVAVSQDDINAYLMGYNDAEGDKDEC